MTAEGWLNGPPPNPAAPGTRLVVSDLWANWCPFCRFAAEDLVQVYRRFSGRGVAFVSLTNLAREPVEAFVRQFSVPWPHGYGARADVLAALGATSGMPGAGYEVAPTVYLIGPDGRVRWTDGRGRMAHPDPKTWARRLAEAIETELAQTPTTKTLDAPSGK